MKSIIYFFIAISVLVCCTGRQKKWTHYLSPGIENIRIFPTNKIDSVRINAIETAIKKNLEECEKMKNTTCIDDRGIMILPADFPKGIYNFRNTLFNHFKLPKKTVPGKNRVRVTIGTENNLEKVEILEYTNENSHKAIENVFKLKELKTWKSASIYGIPAKEQFEISIFIKKVQ